MSSTFQVRANGVSKLGAVDCRRPCASHHSNLAVQTPDIGKARDGPSWVADLNAYIAGQQGSPNSSSTDSREPLVAAVKSNPQSAEAWGALLAHEEAHGCNTTHGLHSGADSGKITLYHLYFWATQLVPRSRDGMYLQLWLGYAKQQW
jgi:hypothetical protein